MDQQPPGARVVLPIDSFLPSIVAAVAQNPCVVLTAEPGAGKTTRVPWALWHHRQSDASDANHPSAREIWVTQPRRLAARLAAHRVAEEMGETLGQTVGYHVRFEHAASDATQLRFMSEGVLLRRLLHDPTLADVGCVILDEFHERHLDSDLALVLLQRLQSARRPDLKIVIMSATLDARWAAERFGAEALLHVPGKMFPVEVIYDDQPDTRLLQNRVATALSRLLTRGLQGDVLVFLPGMSEITRTEQACAALAQAHDLRIVRLHGSLSKEEQQRAVQPAPQRKVILSTNVAETSVTIDGVVAVIDSGLARVPHHNAWSGLASLRTRPISKASAIQRAGRAGRTQPGVCMRLYTQHDMNTRPAHDIPEIQRFDLAPMVLMLHGLAAQQQTAMHADAILAWPWIDPPPTPAVTQAHSVLQRLGALDHQDQITPMGRAMLQMPLHPRTGRMVMESILRGVTDEGCTIAALLEEGSGLARHEGAALSTCSDVLAMMSLYKRADVATHPHVRQTVRQLRDWSREWVRSRDGVDLMRDASRGPAPKNESEREDALCIAVLTAYPDRVGKRYAAAAGSGYDVLLAQGGRYRLPMESAAFQSDLMVVVDVQQREDMQGGGGGRHSSSSSGSKGERVVRMASAIAPEWLLDLYPEHLHESSHVVWNAKAERVEQQSILRYDDLVLEESRRGGVVTDAVSHLLAQMVRQHGRNLYHEDDAVKTLRARVTFLHKHMPEVGFPAWDDANVDGIVDQLCVGCTSFAEVRAQNVQRVLMAQLTPPQQALLARGAPERMHVGRNRSVVVHYESGKPPWIASALQDFFGQRTSPTLADGRASVVVHLLAPNRRPLQITTDLANFWRTHYPALRPALARRYPRHAWPEDPS